jgi:hypothetical protein
MSPVKRKSLKIKLHLFGIVSSKGECVTMISKRSLSQLCMCSRLEEFVTFFCWVSARVSFYHPLIRHQFNPICLSRKKWVYCLNEMIYDEIKYAIKHFTVFPFFYSQARASFSHASILIPNSHKKFQRNERGKKFTLKSIWLGWR